MAIELRTMTDDDTEPAADRDVTITVEAPSVDAVAAAFDLEPAGTTEDGGPPAELQPVLETLADIYGGVQAATEQDSRGRSRKLVRGYAGREDLDGTEVGHVLRVLELHGLVAQDGNRWRVPGEE